MAQRIDVPRERTEPHYDTAGVVTPISRARGTSSRDKASSAPIPLHPTDKAPPTSRRPLWDKNNHGFWLAVCVVISLLFSVIFHAFH